MKKVILIISCLLSLFLCGQAGDLCAEVISVPLYKLAPVKTIDLKCITAEQAISIPVPNRWKISKATLLFNYVNSTALLENKSRMTVRFNGYPVAQINLNPNAPEGSVKLAIPPLLFEAGYNNLSFNVSQHYATDCESYCGAELWTTLKLDQASIEIEYSLKDVPVKLSATSNFLFDPRNSAENEVNIILENTGQEMLTVAGIAASGVAKRFDYRKVSFSTSNSIKPGYDNILIGSKGFVQSFLKANGAPVPDIPGPYLKILPLPKPAVTVPGGQFDPSHALIVVSGIGVDQLKLAAETLSIISSSFPNSDELIATSFTLPNIPMYGGKLIVSPNTKYSFKDMNVPTFTMKGGNPSPKELVFRLPADFLIKPNVYADLSLFFSYGAGTRSDSALNISVNGKLARAIQLDNVKGAIFEGYKLKIPTFMFKPGDNVIRFEGVLTPLNMKACEQMQFENLYLSLYENSTIIFPEMPHFAELPKLELFMLNGFPLTRWPDGKGATFYLTNKDTNTINAALNLLGVITQKNGYPLFEVQFTYTDPKKFDGELIVMGDMQTIPEKYVKAAPLKLTREKTVAYPIARSWSNEKSLAFSDQISDFRPGKGAFMEFLSPYTEGRTVIMLTAVSTQDLLALSDALTESSVQSQCLGDLNLIDLTPPDYKVSALAIGKKYMAGQTGKVSLLQRYLYFYPWLYYLAVALIVISLSLLIFYLLKKYRDRRLKGVSKNSGA
jgi:hypothetical protein